MVAAFYSYPTGEYFTWNNGIMKMMQFNANTAYMYYGLICSRQKPTVASPGYSSFTNENAL
jgi:hypothetical protein